MSGLESGKDRMIIDSVVWAQYVNVTDTQTNMQTDDHAAMAKAELTHSVERQQYHTLQITMLAKQRISAKSKTSCFRCASITFLYQTSFSTFISKKLT